MTEQSFSNALSKLWPKASIQTKQGVLRVAANVFDEFHISSPLVIAHIMAQISHECGNGTIIRESLNYSAERLFEIFGPHRSSAAVTKEEAIALQHNQRLIGERVYNVPKSPKLAKQLGNHIPGDGYNFRGNGMLQLTGRGSHECIGKLIGMDLAANPGILENPSISFRVAVAEFVALGAVEWAEKDNVTMVTKKVNGGNNGLAERTVLLRKWKEALPGIEAPAWSPRVAEKPPSLVTSKIMQGAVGTAASIGTATLSKVAENANTSTSVVSIQDVADKVQQASDTVTTITGMKDNASVMVQTVKPFLGVAPNTWSIIAIAAICVAVLAIGYTIYQRYAKMRDQGV